MITRILNRFNISTRAQLHAQVAVLKSETVRQRSAILDLTEELKGTDKICARHVARLDKNTKWSEKLHTLVRLASDDFDTYLGMYGKGSKKNTPSQRAIARAKLRSRVRVIAEAFK